MKDMKYYDSLPWEVQIERDVRADGSIYYVARHPEFGEVSGPIGTGVSPEEALAELKARRSLIAVLLERGGSIPEPRPVRAGSRRSACSTSLGNSVRRGGINSSRSRRRFLSPLEIPGLETWAGT